MGKLLSLVAGSTNSEHRAEKGSTNKDDETPGSGPAGSGGSFYILLVSCACSLQFKHASDLDVLYSAVLGQVHEPV